jgi:hypothetical protein
MEVESEMYDCLHSSFAVAMAGQDPFIWKTVSA